MGAKRSVRLRVSYEYDSSGMILLPIQERIARVKNAVETENPYAEKVRVSVVKPRPRRKVKR